MIDLGEQYMAAGCLLESQELPDFVPVFLEYASCLEPAEARETLGQPAHVFAALAERLAQRGSDYAAVFHALVILGDGRLDQRRAERAAARTRPPTIPPGSTRSGRRRRSPSPSTRWAGRPA